MLLVMTIMFAGQFKAQAAVIAPPDEENDADNDGVTDDTDMCLGTDFDANPLEKHYAWLGGERFMTTDPKTKLLVASNYFLTDTQGCACAQILEQKSGNNNGEQKYDCSKGTMDNFIKNN